MPWETTLGAAPEYDSVVWGLWWLVMARGPEWTVFGETNTRSAFTRLELEGSFCQDLAWTWGWLWESGLLVGTPTVDRCSVETGKHLILIQGSAPCRTELGTLCILSNCKQIHGWKIPYAEHPSLNVHKRPLVVETEGSAQTIRQAIANPWQVKCPESDQALNAQIAQLDCPLTEPILSKAPLLIHIK